MAVKIFDGAPDQFRVILGLAETAITAETEHSPDPLGVVGMIDVLGPGAATDSASSALDPEDLGHLLFGHSVSEFQQEILFAPIEPLFVALCTDVVTRLAVRVPPTLRIACSGELVQWFR
jgi:hypothetical protein